MSHKIKILLVSDLDDEVKNALSKIFDSNTANFEFFEASSIDDAIEFLVLDAPDLTFVYDVETGGRTLDLLNDIAVRGVKNDLGVNNSIIAVVAPHAVSKEDEIIKLGGKGQVSIDASFNEALNFIVRFAIEMKRLKATQTAEKEDLTRELLETHDTREREAELNYELSGIAEELTLVKKRT